MQIKKNVLSVFLSIVLALGLCPGLAFALTVHPAVDPASGTWTDGTNSCSWTLDGSGALVVTPGIASGCNGTMPDASADSSAPWKDSTYSSSITSVAFQDESGTKVTARSDISSLFAECTSLTSINLSGLDTSSVINMRSLFSNCQSLTQINLTGVTTGSVTDMGSMFNNCLNLETVDVSGFSTGNVQKMDGMFDTCAKLSALDLSNFSTGSVSTTDRMFYGCESLTSLTLSNFSSTTYLTDAGYMFYGCKSLTNLNASLSTVSATDLSYMFAGCENLTEINGVNQYKTTSNPDTSYMFKDCKKLRTIEFAAFAGASNMKGMLEGCSALSTITMYSEFRFTLPSDGSGYAGIGIQDASWTPDSTSYISTKELIESRDPSATGLPFSVTYTRGSFTVTEGANATWDNSMGASGPALTITSSMPYELFDHLEIGGSTVDSSNYTASSGSTVIVLQPSYLAGLSATTYNVDFVSKNGDKASTTFTVSGGSVTPPVDPGASTVITSITVTGSTNLMYNGSPRVPVIEVKAGDTVLRENVAYTISFDIDNTVPGNPTATINAMSGYTFASNVVRTISFTITKAFIESATVLFDKDTFTYDGSSHRPVVQVSYLTSNLIENTDYTVSFPEDVISAGTKTVTITGMGNYTGTITKTYTISEGSGGGSDKPDNPNNPDNPDDPNKPDNPENPDKPSNPGDPDKPNDPENPGPTTETTKVMCRLYNPYSGEHLFTSDVNEIKTLMPLGWVYENIAWIAPAKSDTPVYRLYNPNNGDHHYTADVVEYDYLESLGWRKEGICWYSDDAKGVPVYRVFNPNGNIGSHHYTKDENEYNTLGDSGWNKENVCWYGLKQDKEVKLNLF